MDQTNEQLVKRLALEAGFNLAGIARVDAKPARLPFLSEWLAKGYAGEMEYLKRQEAKRLDPHLILPGVKSLLCVALLYNTERPYSTEVPDQAWVSRYAWGDDYHELLGKTLQRLEAALKAQFAGLQCKSYVDTGPVAEKAWAAAAGLGWIGKNTCLINPKLGSWLFLGEILMNLDLQADGPGADLCGNCRRCLDACPTGAFPEAYVLDARRCISYLSIEKRGELEDDLQALMGRHLYGCDICQDVCPWNHWKVTTQEPAFQARPGNWQPDLEALAQMSDEEFAKNFKGSAMKRSKAEGLRRNAGIVRKNLKF